MICVSSALLDADQLNLPVSISSRVLMDEIWDIFECYKNVTLLLSPPEISAAVRLAYLLVSEHTCALRPSLNRVFLSILFPPFSYCDPLSPSTSPSLPASYEGISLCFMKSSYRGNQWLWAPSTYCPQHSAGPLPLKDLLCVCFPLLISFPYVYV